MCDPSIAPITAGTLLCSSNPSITLTALLPLSHLMRFSAKLFFMASHTRQQDTCTELFVTLNLSEIELLHSFLPKNHKKISNCLPVEIGGLPPCQWPSGISGQ